MARRLRSRGHLSFCQKKLALPGDLQRVDTAGVLDLNLPMATEDLMTGLVRRVRGLVTELDMLVHGCAFQIASHRLTPFPTILLRNASSM
jgi:hypothetical protein